MTSLNNVLLQEWIWMNKNTFEWWFVQAIASIVNLNALNTKSKDKIVKLSGKTYINNLPNCLFWATLKIFRKISLQYYKPIKTCTSTIKYQNCIFFSLSLSGSSSSMNGASVKWSEVTRIARRTSPTYCALALQIMRNGYTIHPKYSYSPNLQTLVHVVLATFDLNYLN